MNSNTIRITLKINSQVNDQLNELKKIYGRSKYFMINKALENYLGLGKAAQAPLQEETIPNRDIVNRQEVKGLHETQVKMKAV